MFFIRYTHNQKISNTILQTLYLFVYLDTKDSYPMKSESNLRTT